MPARRKLTLAAVMAVGAGAVAACGSQEIKLDRANRGDRQMERGAELFAQRCSGCHTLAAAGAQGSSSTIKDRERVDGPNFNVRKAQVDQVLYAIRNGGYSGAIMPQNIVVGQDARDVAAFLAKYAGREAKSPPTPGQRIQPTGGRRREVRGGGTDQPADAKGQGAPGR